MANIIKLIQYDKIKLNCFIVLLVHCFLRAFFIIYIPGYLAPAEFRSPSFLPWFQAFRTGRLPQSDYDVCNYICLVWGLHIFQVVYWYILSLLLYVSLSILVDGWSYRVDDFARWAFCFNILFHVCIWCYYHSYLVCLPDCFWCSFAFLFILLLRQPYWLGWTIGASIFV